MQHDRSDIRVTRLTPLSPEELPESVRRYRAGRRLILCVDGGGIRGILTLQALKALEEHVGGRCIDIFDMFAGTSTGAIIAGGLAWGVSVDDLIELYRDEHRTIFARSKRWLVVAAAAAVLGALFGYAAGAVIGAVAGALLAGTGGGLIGRSQLVVPVYDHRPFRRILESLFGDDTLAHCHRDVLITGKDTVRAETTYFTAFHSSPMPRDETAMESWLASVRGTYKNVMLRSAILASAGSVPIYFRPVGRFVDGGVGSFTNVSYAAPVEALRFSAEPREVGRLNDDGKVDPGGRWPIYDYPAADQLYRPGEVGVVSFGTGKRITNMEVGEAKRISTALGWIGWIINEILNDADEHQSYVALQELMREQQAIDFRRFQIHFTPQTMEVLRNLVPGLPDRVDGSKLTLDAVRQFELLDAIGRGFGAWLRQSRSGDDRSRFDLREHVALGHPVTWRPERYHIDEYSREVMEELARRS